MEQHQTSVWNRTTLILLFLCVGGAFFFLRLLHQDMNRIAGEGTGTPMAVVEQVREKVKRKPASTFMWNPSKEGQSLYRKDSIQTGPGSAAIVKFTDGTTVEMGEDSLVVIDKVDELGESLIRGNLITRGAKGDQKLAKGKDGKTKSQVLSLRLIEPKPLEVMFSEAAKRSITFVWLNPKNSLPQSGKFDLQVSTSPAFASKETKSYSLADAIPGEQGRSSFTNDLKAGRYYWRIIDGGDPVTERREFRMVSVSAPIGIAPKIQSIKTWTYSTNIQFQWKSNMKTTAGVEGDFELQIARDKEFESLVKKTEIALGSQTAIISKIPVGDYFWRIKGQLGDVSTASIPLPFKVVQNANIEIVLKSPSEKASIPINKQIGFGWDVENVLDTSFRYRLNIKKLKDKEDELPSKERVFDAKSSRFITWKPLSVTRSLADESDAMDALKKDLPGVYSWRVEALRSDGQVQASSEERTFELTQAATLTLKAPRDGTSIEDDRDNVPAPEFSWGEVTDSEVTSLRMEFARDIGFKQIVFKKDLNDVKTDRIEAAQFQIPAGQYFWRVLGNDANGKTLLRSNVWKYTVQPSPLLAAPEVVLPKDGVAYNPVQDEEDLELEWKEVNGAKKYIVQFMVPSKKGNRVIASQITEDSKYKIRKLPEGTVLWSVRAIDKADRKGKESAQSKLSISYGASLKAPTIKLE